MLARALCSILLLASAPALADDATPATEIKPETATPEQAVRASLILMKEQKAEEWIKTWCTPSRCATEKQKEDLRRYMLKQAQLTSKNCLHGEHDELKIKSVEGDPATDDKVSIRVECTHSSYPPPAVVEKVNGRWYVTSIPW